MLAAELGREGSRKQAHAAAEVAVAEGRAGLDRVSGEERIQGPEMGCRGLWPIGYATQEQENKGQLHGCKV